MRGVGPRAIAIVNPVSSNGRAMRRWTELARGLQLRLGALDLVQTEAPGHATRLTRAALEAGVELVISIGGDGTNNEVLCGFVDEVGVNRFPQAELGLVRSGTGGDFLRHLGEASPQAQIAHLVDGPAHAIDYGIATFVDHEGHDAIRPFLNVASAGISGLVDHHVRTATRRLGATATYLYGSLRGIYEYRSKLVEVVVDDGEPHVTPIDLAVAANGQYFGGGMWIAPRASCVDAMLDMVWTGGLGKARLVALLGKVFRGAHVDAPGVFTARGRSMQLAALDEADEVLLDLDGEQPGRLPASFRMVPRGIRVRAAGLPGPARVR